jgi:hypothetical protein
MPGSIIHKISYDPVPACGRKAERELTSIRAFVKVLTIYRERSRRSKSAQSRQVDFDLKRLLASRYTAERTRARAAAIISK